MERRWARFGLKPRQAAREGGVHIPRAEGLASDLQRVLGAEVVELRHAEEGEGEDEEAADDPGADPIEHVAEGAEHDPLSGVPRSRTVSVGFG